MSKSKARFLAELLSSDGKVIKTKSQASTIVVGDLPTIPNSKLANSSVTIAGEGLSLGASLTLDTGDVTEHTAYKYYTDTRARASISATGSLSYDKNTGVMSFTMPAQNTSNITEGSNLYYTDTRARAAISATGSLSYNSTTGVMCFTMPAQNTSNITEGSNLYYTNARADARIVNAGSANWNTAYSWGNHASAGYSTTDTTYSVQDGELSQNNFTNADHSKLDGIAASANNYSHPSNHAISVITGLQTALDGKVDDSQVLTNVPSGAVFTDTNTTYSVGDGGLSQNNFTNADHSKLDGIATGATNTAAPHYTSAIAVGAGGLTQQNFTTTLKNKLDGIAASANNYVLPSGYATESYVGTQISNLVDSSPAALNTLNELAAAIGDDASFSTTVTNNIATKLPLAGGTLTGNLTAPTLYLNNTNTRLHEGSGDSLRISTSTGYIDIGSMNSGWIHFQGNKPYYFNQPMHIDNHLYPYSTAGARNIGGTGNIWNHVYAKGYFIDSTEVIDASRNLTNIGTISSGVITATGGNSGNWNTAYGWGNHASGGYLTSSSTQSKYLRSDTDDTATGQYTFSKVNDHAIRVGTIRGTVVGSNSGEYIQMYNRVHIGSPAGWGSRAAPTYGLSTYGGADLATDTGSVTISGSTAWHAGNDGSGSGLDADLLDGLHGASFLRSDADGTATGSISLRGPGNHLGNHEFASSSTGTSYSTAAIELRESNYTATSSATPPQIGFHWGGVVASNISMDSGGAILIRNNPGTAYENFRANNIYANGTNTVWHVGNDGAGSGLDADLLDGQQASAFATSAQGTLATNALPKAGGTLTGTLTTAGNIVVPANTGLQTSGTETKFTTAHGYIQLGPMNTSYAHIYTNIAGGFYFNKNNLYANGNTMWTAGNDGAGSGLDADLLDGQQGSYYYAASNPSAYLTASGSITQSHNVSGSAFATTGSPGSVLEYQQAASQTDTKLAPSTDWYNSIRMGHGNPYSYYSNTMAMKMTGTGSGTLYTQVISNNSAGGWNKYWHTNNDGAGSGLDADLLDGQQGSYYLPTTGKAADSNLLDGIDSTYFNRGDQGYGVMVGTSGWNMNDLFTTRNRAGFFDVWSGSNFPPSTSHVHGMQVRHNSSAHYGWQLAGQYGQNKLWHRQVSNGTFGAWNQQWGSGNDGAGSGLDADLLDGQQGSYYLDQAATRARTASSYSGNQNMAAAALQFQSSSSGQGAHSYAIFQEAGAWSHPYPDLRIAYHTGIKLGAHYSYGGTRFYNNSDMATELFSVGNGDNHVRVAEGLYIGSGGSLRKDGPNIQGTSHETRIANGDGETVFLGLNSAGKVVGAEYESSITMTKAQFASLGHGTDTYMVMGRPGYIVIPLESMFILKCSAPILHTHGVPSVIQVRQENCSGGHGTVSQITSTQIRAACPAAGTTVIQRDIPLTQRDYKENVNTYFRFGAYTWASATPFVSITVMIKYRLIKSSDYN